MFDAVKYICGALAQSRQNGDEGFNSISCSLLTALGGCNNYWNSWQLWIRKIHFITRDSFFLKCSLGGHLINGTLVTSMFKHSMKKGIILTFYHRTHFTNL
jgi:hypothetical protein